MEDGKKKEMKANESINKFDVQNIYAWIYAVLFNFQAILRGDPVLPYI